MAEGEKCEHKACNSVSANDSDYCSDHCKDAAEQDIMEIACDCGHASCGYIYCTQ